MARNVTAILRDIETINKSPYLNAGQKTTAVNSLKEELNALVGQGSLDLEQPKQETDKAKK